MKTTEQAPEQILLNFAEWFNAKKNYRYITPELINEYLIGLNPKANMAVELVLKKIADYFKVTVSKIKSKDSKVKYARPRQVATYILYYELRVESWEIALIFKQNRSTIWHSIKTVENQYMHHIDNIMSKKND